MELTEYIINKFKQNKKDIITIGICGRAGSGKTTLAKKISNKLSSKKMENVFYSGDWRFKLDSKNRKIWLREKWKVGMDAYLYAINQFTWWDFKKIYQDLNVLSKGYPLQINGAYDRTKGEKNLKIKIPAIKNGVIIYENCILGNVGLLENIDIIVLLNTPNLTCLERIIKKDLCRKNLTDIVSRFIITTYSENIFFENILANFKNKTIFCDSNGNFGELPTVENISNIPVPIIKSKSKIKEKGTIFCDLDGTLIKHVPIPSEDGKEMKIIEGSPEKLREFKENGYHLIITSSRPYNKIFGIIDKLKSGGIEFDQIICDLPVGPRHLINDSKGNEIRAIAHVLERNKGIKSIEIS